LTKTIHGEAEAVNARDAAKALFGKGGDGDLAAMPSIHIAKPEIENGINVVDLFARTSLCSSKAEARRLITQGGAFINDTSVSDINTAIYLSEKKELPKDIKPIFLNEKNPILRAGKKRYFRIIID